MNSTNRIKLRDINITTKGITCYSSRYVKIIKERTLS